MVGTRKHFSRDLIISMLSKI
uniref:Uncharacterized protein n=1 Tax=Heterorhabditis bacteriophora TaxID=37862 RepID=A0A1I7WAM9_HETBA